MWHLGKAAGERRVRACMTRASSQLRRMSWREPRARDEVLLAWQDKTSKMCITLTLSSASCRCFCRSLTFPLPFTRPLLTSTHSIYCPAMYYVLAHTYNISVLAHRTANISVKARIQKLTAGCRRVENCSLNAILGHSLFALPIGTD